MVYMTHGTMYQGRTEVKCPLCGYSTWLARDNNRIVCTKQGCTGELPCRRKTDKELPILETW